MPYVATVRKYAPVIKCFYFLFHRLIRSYTSSISSQTINESRSKQCFDYNSLFDITALILHLLQMVFLYLKRIVLCSTNTCVLPREINRVYTARGETVIFNQGVHHNVIIIKRYVYNIHTDIVGLLKTQYDYHKFHLKPPDDGF